MTSKTILFLGYLFCFCLRAEFITVNGVNNKKPEFFQLKKDCERYYPEDTCFEIKVDNETELKIKNGFLSAKVVYTKKEVEFCLEDSECEEKFYRKRCVDQEEVAILNLDIKEVYCSKKIVEVTEKVKEFTEFKAVYEREKGEMNAARVLQSKRDCLRLVVSRFFSVFIEGADKQVEGPKVLELKEIFSFLEFYFTAKAREIIFSSSFLSLDEKNFLITKIEGCETGI